MLEVMRREGIGMPTDYANAPRRTETDDVSEDSLKSSKHDGTRRRRPWSMDQIRRVTSRLPGAPTCPAKSIERVVPKQADEFTCSSCFFGATPQQVGQRKNSVMMPPTCRPDRSAAQRRRTPARVAARNQYGAWDRWGRRGQPEPWATEPDAGRKLPDRVVGPAPRI